jgi:hypothetical protein
MAAEVSAGLSRVLTLDMPPARPRSSIRIDKRDRMHRLDACLEQLEAANLGSANRVPSHVAMAFAPDVPGLTDGMRVSEAINLVFSAQDSLMHGHLEEQRAAPEAVQPEKGGGQLSQTQAQSLTDEIRAALGNACIPLFAAHMGKAWRALGYKTWARYVHAEFGLSRSRSYELLVQARVMHALRRAAGMSEFPDVSAHAAAQVLPQLSNLERTVAGRLVGQAFDDRGRANVVRSAVEELRGIGHSNEPVSANQKAAIDSLMRALRTISALPHPAQVANELLSWPEPMDLQLVDQGHSWLRDLAEALHSQRRVLCSAAS